VRHDLADWINEYIAVAGIPETDKAKASPLFRSADQTKKLTRAGYTAHSMRQR
jgi:hypothetical protein